MNVAKKMTRIVSFIVLFLPLVGFAQNSREYNADVTFYAGGFLGDNFIFHPPQLFESVGTALDDDFIGGFRLAYNLNRHFALEGSLGFTPASFVSEGRVNGGFTGSGIVKADTYVFSANLLTNLVRKGPVRPFLTGGVSAVHFDFEDSPFLFGLTPSETDFATNVGGGFRIPFRENMSARFDARYYWLNPEFSEDDDPRFLELSGGISVDFDF